MAEIVTLAVGMPKEMRYDENRTLVTGIKKSEVAEVLLTKQGFMHDDVADKKHHGGPDRAVCLYPIEHYEKWEKEFGKPLPKSAFGENLTVRGMLEQDVCIGDVYAVGEAVIEITQGRVPCSTIDKYTSASSLMKRLVQTGYTGYLARVLQEGVVRADDRITLQTKGEGQLTIVKCNQIYFTNDQQAMAHMLTIPALADEWKFKFAKRLGS